MLSDEPEHLANSDTASQLPSVLSVVRSAERQLREATEEQEAARTPAERSEALVKRDTAIRALISALQRLKDTLHESL